MYSRKNEEAPCIGCLPQLNSENEDAIRVYSIVRDQMIFAGMSGTPIGIKHDAVWRVIDEYGVDDRIGTFEKVLTLSQQDIKKMRMKMEAKNMQSKPVRKT